MRLYTVATVVGLAGVAMLAGAAVIAHRRHEPAPAAGSERPGLSDRGGSVWGASYFPNIPLVTQDGRRVRFFDDLIKDKVVAISFMYTSCPDTCPVETARMLQVAHLLGDRLGRDVFFYSITIDPDHDTQPVLKAFTDSWGIPDGWTFLTGEKRDIIHLRKKLGMRLDDVRSGDFADHTVNMLLGNQKTGVWLKRAPFENPYYLANQIGNWLHGFKLAKTERRNYADAPEMRQISDGEYVFRNRCSACHTIGGGDLRGTDARRIGPDLFDVTRQRERAWLERWLAEPDVMLAENDPVATALRAAYNDVPMPNMRLTERDVTAILGYIEGESQRIRAVRSGKMADHSGHMGHEGPMGQMDHGEGRGEPAGETVQMEAGEPAEHAHHAATTSG